MSEDELTLAMHEALLSAGNGITRCPIKVLLAKPDSGSYHPASTEGLSTGREQGPDLLGDHQALVNLNGLITDVPDVHRWEAT